MTTTVNSRQNPLYRVSFDLLALFAVLLWLFLLSQHRLSPLSSLAYRYTRNKTQVRLSVCHPVPSRGEFFFIFLPISFFFFLLLLLLLLLFGNEVPRGDVIIVDGGLILCSTRNRKWQKTNSRTTVMTVSTTSNSY